MVGRLETQEGWGYVSSPENQENHWGKFQTDGGKTNDPAQPLQQREQLLPPCAFVLCGVFNGVDEAYPHWGGQSFPSLWIQMLIFSGNTIRDAPAVMFNQLSGPNQVDT